MKELHILTFPFCRRSLRKTSPLLALAAMTSNEDGGGTGGAVTISASSVTCDNGTWSTIPRCEPARCKALPAPPLDGMVVVSSFKTLVFPPPSTRRGRRRPLSLCYFPSSGEFSLTFISGEEQKCKTRARLGKAAAERRPCIISD